MSDQSYNIYDDDDDENVITDDSSGVEENDDLMNVAVSSLNDFKSVHVKPTTSNKKQNKRMEKERLRLKKKYIVWANKKSQREQIINYFLSGHVRRKYNQVNQQPPVLNELMETDEECAEYRTKISFPKSTPSIPTETIALDDTDFEDETYEDDARNGEEHDAEKCNGNECDVGEDNIDEDDEDDGDKRDGDKNNVFERCGNEYKAGNRNDFENDGSKIDKKYVNKEKEDAEEMKRKEKERRLIKDNLLADNALKAADIESIMQREYADVLNSASSPENSTNSSSRPDTSQVAKEGTTHNFNNTKLDTAEDIFFSEELNIMYSKFDKIIGKHVHSLKSMQSVENKVKLITLDVQALNRQLEVKEREYNKLLYEKKVKEEVLIRMLRHFKLLEIKKKPLEGKKYDLMALKQLEDAISTYLNHSNLKEKPMRKMSAGDVLEKRANMTGDELHIERATWGSLENMLKQFCSEKSVTITDINELLKKPLRLPKHSIVNQYSEDNEPSISNHKFNASMQYTDDVTEDDFHEQSQINSTKILNRMMFQLEDINGSSDAETVAIPNFSTPEKLITKSVRNRSRSQSNSQLQKKFFQRNDSHSIVPEKRNFQDDISVVPVFKETKYIPQTASKCEQLVVRLESPSAKLCQHCSIHEARFLCAACQKQWYCSRRCQVTAWKDHCDSCE